MRQSSADEVAAAARRRLDLLRRELVASGLEQEGPDADPVTEADLRPAAEQSAVEQGAVETVATGGQVAPAVVVDAGRHLRRRVTGADRVRDWGQRLLPEGLRGRVSMGPAHLTLAVVLVALGLTVAAVLALRSVGDSSPVPPVSRSSQGGALPSALTSPLASPASSSGPAGVASPSPDAGSAGSRAGQPVVVDVAGKVRHPGVFSLPSGSRVVDAIKRAGGLRGHPPLAGLNRARVLVDGEQILVGVSPAPGVAPSAAAAPGAATTGGLVNLNTATGEQLEALPGVGPVTAEKILAWRTSHGSFSSVDELLEVDGIGEKTLAELAPHLTL